MQLLTTILLSAAAASVVASELGDDDRHVAEGELATVTTMWRSERALDRHAKELQRIADASIRAADALVGQAPADAPRTQLEVYPSPAIMRRTLDGRGSGGRRGKKRRSGVVADSPTVPISRRGPSGEAIALATGPVVHDRVMFGTGIQPAGRWAVAIEAAHARLASHADLDPGEREAKALRAAFTGLGVLDNSIDDPAREPYLSTGMWRLVEHLADTDTPAQALIELAETAPLDHLVFDADGPFCASAASMARYLLDEATGEEAERAAAVLVRLESSPPHWDIECGSITRHPFGWQAVASRQRDALALSTEPLGPAPFTIRTGFVMFPNDLGAGAQADLVIGDVDGDRLLLACNTKHGIYLFHRAGPDAEYETLTEFKEFILPIASPVPVTIIWDGAELAINVGGADIPKLRLAPEVVAGRWGFGVHAGVSALFSDLEVER